MPDNEGARVLGQAINGLVTDTARIAGRPVARYRAMPEGPDKNRKRASYGIGILTAGILFLRAVYPGTWGATLNGYVHTMQKPAAEVWLYYIWTGLMLLGLLWLAVGLMGSRGPRNIMSGIWALIIAGACAAALWYEFYFDDYKFDDLNDILHGIYVTVLAASLMAVYLHLRGSGSGAAGIVRMHIIQQIKVFRLRRNTNV